MSARRLFFLLLLLCGEAIAFAAPPVQVTVKLDAASLNVGDKTTLHVFAQIIQPLRASTDRIFSWYIDVLNSDGSVLQIDSANLVKTTSDKDPRTSASGTVDGPNLRGIYDTFLNLAAAGKDTPVELCTVPIKAVGPGKVILSIQAGTTVTGLDADFLVAPSDGSDPLLGADYSVAKADLQVTGSGGVLLAAVVTTLAPGQGQKVTLSFPTTAGHTYTVEGRNGFEANTAWLALSGAPHNSGSVTDTSASTRRFYRLKITTP